MEKSKNDFSSLFVMPLRGIMGGFYEK